jgi:hypothetical protein
MSEINNNKEDLFAFLSKDKQEVDLPFIDEDLEEVVTDVDQDIVDVKEEVVTIPEPTVEKTVVETVEDGVVGTSVKAAKTTKKIEKPKPTVKANLKEKVAIHSTKNVTWSSVGTVYVGFNIVTPAVAEKWLERKHIRLATPEEVAKEFGL